LCTDREALRRTLLTTLLSIIATTGWLAISSRLPTFTVTLSKADGRSRRIGLGLADFDHIFCGPDRRLSGIGLYRK
jgi:hypothetical protein